jgi:uncharacterized membrane protein
MKINRSSLLSLALVVLSFVIAAAMYDKLPELSPTRFTPKPWGPFILPLVMLGVCLLFLAIPRISPRGYRVERFQDVFEITQVALLALLFLVSILVLLPGVGVPVPVRQAARAGTGLLFVILGNFMGKSTKNFFFGIRTPWTLASDEVWLRTNRLGGKLVVLAGLVLLASSLVGAGAVWFLVTIPVAVGIPVVYSYFLYRRIEGFKNGTNGRDTPLDSP